MTSNSVVVLSGVDHLIDELSDSPTSALESQAAEEPAQSVIESAKSAPTLRGPAVEVNRFLLCVVASQSAKRIKERAQRMGETLPMTMSVRAFMRAYRLAEKDGIQPLAESDPNTPYLRRLRERVLNDEIARLASDTLNNIKVRLALARRLGDDSRIIAEQDELDREIKLRNRLTDKSS